MGESLSRQGGGGGGGGARRGAGETKLNWTAAMSTPASTHWPKNWAEMPGRACLKLGCPYWALVGYTNVGKSSLMNALAAALQRRFRKRTY